MAWTTPRTVRVGDVIDASIWNTDERDNLNFLHGNGWFKYNEQTASGVSSYSSAPDTTFSQIEIICCIRSDTVATDTSLFLQFATGGGALDGGANYSYNSAVFTGAGVQSNSSAVNNTGLVVGSVPAANATANTFGMYRILIPNFNQATGHKSVRSYGSEKRAQTGTGDLSVYMCAGWWQNTGAITEVGVLISAGNFVAGSYASFYGLV